MSSLDKVNNITVCFPNIKDVNFHRKCSKGRTNSGENVSKLVPGIQQLTCKVQLRFTC